MVSECWQVPHTMQALVLRGTGEQNLELTTVKVPECGGRDLLARVDAVIACASDNKLIDQGAEHPLTHGWDPAVHPVIVGDEGTVTVVEVGSDLRGQFELGERYCVQPAVDHAPINHLERYRDEGRGVAKIAVGYSLPGTLAEYILIGEEILAAVRAAYPPPRHRILRYAGSTVGAGLFRPAQSG